MYSSDKEHVIIRMVATDITCIVLKKSTDFWAVRGIYCLSAKKCSHDYQIKISQPFYFILVLVFDC